MGFCFHSPINDRIITFRSKLMTTNNFGTFSFGSTSQSTTPTSSANNGAASTGAFNTTGGYGSSAGGFSFGSSTSASKPNSGYGSSTGGFGFGTTAADKPVEPKDIPEEIKSKTVKQCLELFEEQLEQQTKQFQSQARQIAKWDRMIYDSMALIQHLEQQIEAVEGAQTELGQTAELFLHEQEEFLKELDLQTKDTPPESTDQRQRLYRLAHDLGERLIDMENQLKSIVEQLESYETGTSEVDRIRQVLNFQLSRMQAIERNCHQLESSQEEIQRQLPQDLN